MLATMVVITWSDITLARSHKVDPGWMQYITGMNFVLLIIFIGSHSVASGP